MSQTFLDQFFQLCRAVVNERASVIHLPDERGGVGVICTVDEGDELMTAKPLALLLPPDAEPMQFAKLAVERLDPRRN